MTTPIEELWSELRAAGSRTGQRRIDATHPHDIYADFGADRAGLVILTSSRPNEPEPLRSLAIERGLRTDGRWSLHLSLLEPSLVAVFAALCMDIVEATRSGVDEAGLASAVLMRVERWRTLLLRDRAGLDESVLRGLIGELHVLESRVLAAYTPGEAVAAWIGPIAGIQDFLLPDGQRFEVKAIAPNAAHVRINGLEQLNTTAGPIRLLAVRMQRTGTRAPDRVTAPDLIARVRERIVSAPAALLAFDDALASMGWHEHPAHDEFAVVITGLDDYDVDTVFPRLTPDNAPAGVVDADYLIELPPIGAPS